MSTLLKFSLGSYVLTLFKKFENNLLVRVNKSLLRVLRSGYCVALCLRSGLYTVKAYQLFPGFFFSKLYYQPTYSNMFITFNSVDSFHTYKHYLNLRIA